MRQNESFLGTGWRAELNPKRQRSKVTDVTPTLQLGLGL